MAKKSSKSATDTRSEKRVAAHPRSEIETAAAQVEVVWKELDTIAKAMADEGLEDIHFDGRVQLERALKDLTGFLRNARGGLMAARLEKARK